MDFLRLHQHFASPVEIASIEVLRHGNRHWVRVRSQQGAVGLALCNQRMSYFAAILLQKVAPFFIGKDARDLETLVDEVARYQANYKLGFALWNCVGSIEFALFDLLGQLSQKSVGALLGGVVRQEVPVYLSSLRRDTSAPQEVEWLQQRLAQTGARAVKIKIGGRMSANADAFPGRTQSLIALARQEFVPDVEIFADANGSYDAAHAIEIGRMLEEHRIALFEEPCPFEEYEQTKAVADALDMPVAGGEQDFSAARFRWMIEHRGVDVLQPDVNYNGGFIRTLRVAREAAAAGIPITPHSPKQDANAAYMLHLVSVLPGAGRFHEYHAHPAPVASWFAPHLQVQNGAITVPSGPGLGIEYDPQLLSEAETISSTTSPASG